jgi:hypothetical protein
MDITLLFPETEVQQTADLINNEIGDAPGYVFYAYDADIAEFDTLWAAKKYSEALNMLASCYDIDCANYLQIFNYIKNA